MADSVCPSLEGHPGFFPPPSHLPPPMDSAAALKLEIARLSGKSAQGRITETWLDETGLGAIDRHKSGASYKPPSRTNVYVNPNYKPPPRSTQVPPRPAPYHRPAPIKDTGEKRDVVLNGVAFKSSGLSLVRKDREYTWGKCGVLVSLTRAAVPQLAPPAPGPSNFKPTPRYPAKPRPARQRARPGRNLTLATGRTSSVVLRIHNPLTTYPPFRYKATQKRMKFSDKQCPRFTTTGIVLLSSHAPLCPSESWCLITFLLLSRQLQQRSHLSLSTRPRQDRPLLAIHPRNLSQ